MNNAKRINLIVNKVDEAARRYSEQDTPIKHASHRFSWVWHYLRVFKKSILSRRN